MLNIHSTHCYYLAAQLKISVFQLKATVPTFAEIYLGTTTKVFPILQFSQQMLTFSYCLLFLSLIVLIHLEQDILSLWHPVKS